MRVLRFRILVPPYTHSHSDTQEHIPAHEVHPQRLWQCTAWCTWLPLSCLHHSRHCLTRRNIATVIHFWYKKHNTAQIGKKIHNHLQCKHVLKVHLTLSYPMTSYDAVKLSFIMSLLAMSLGLRFCMSRKGGIGGGGWVYPKGANSIAVSGLACRKDLVGTWLALGGPLLPFLA